MIVAGQGERSAKLLVADADGGLRNLSRAALAWLFRPGDLIVANDAATLPASLIGTHCASGDAIEIRLAAWESVGDPTRFTAIAFRSGDHRTPTEERIVASLAPDDRLTLGPLVAVVEHCLASRLFKLRFVGERTSILAGLPDTQGRSNTPTSQRYWPWGTSGQELLPIRSPSNLPPRVSR
jgi:S-adenosylmethionine:tRNA ribosyltransferase-isomerase